jgi:hypothetical protein
VTVPRVHADAQTDKQKRVEARIEELGTEASKKLGMERRQFLKGYGEIQSLQPARES